MLQTIANVLFISIFIGAVRGLMSGRLIIPRALRIDLRTTSYDTLSESLEFQVTKNASTGALEDGHGANFATSIYLGGTAGANLLDDYEEGTWTPIFKVGTTTQSITGLFSEYVKIGKTVCINTRFQQDGAISGTGGLSIENLPFAMNTDSNYFLSIGIEMLNLTSNPASTYALFRRDLNRIDLRKYTSTSGGGTSMDDTDVQDNTQIRMSGTYLID